MATTTNYGWDTPDDTDLVKDGAAAIRTLGSSIDTTTKNLNPSTTLGDIEYRSSTANTNTRLGIGSTGQVLTVSGGVPAWATPSGGTSNWEIVNSGGTSLTGSTTTISGISGKDKILILIQGASANGNGTTFQVRLNGDTNSNYFNYGAELEAGSTYSASMLGNTGSGTSSIRFGNNGSNAASTVDGYVLLTGCNSSGVKVFQSVAAHDAGGGNGQFHYYVGGYYNNATVISSVSIGLNTNNFDAGTIFVYASA